MAPGPVIVDHYAELGISFTADAAAIKKSYRQLVLKYHPDKNPEDRDTAEEKIRRINNAYETLSVPAKRAAYDAQARSMLTKANGIRVDTTMIQPRMAIPKSFMLCPMGHPDKFVRAVGRSLFVHSRADVPNVDFDQFFSAARYSLWWLPEINNMCRLRLQPLIFSGVVNAQDLAKTAGGPPVGSIISFGLSAQDTSSDVMLSEMEQPVCTNLIAVASPDYPGAFRFDAAFFRGHYFSFDPPNRTQMIRDGADRFAVIDFMLMDFIVAEQFRTLDEVLAPVVMELGGDRQHVKLTSVCQHGAVQGYFQSVMAGALWDFNDFATYFQAHSERWDYIPSKQMLRLRGFEDNLSRSLLRAKTPKEAIAILVNTSKQKQEPRWLAIDAAKYALKILSQAHTLIDADGGKESQKVLLLILQRMCSDGIVSLDDLITLRSCLSVFSKSEPDVDVAKLREELASVALARAAKLICAGEFNVDLNLLESLLDLPLDWDTCAAAVSQKGQQFIAKQPLDKLVPLIKKAAAAKAGKFGECLATSAMMKLFGTEPEQAIEALDAMVSGKFGMEGVPMILRMQLPKVSNERSAHIVAALADHGASGADFQACWDAVTKQGIFDRLPDALRIRLEAHKGARERSRSRSQGTKLLYLSSLDLLR